MNADGSRGITAEFEFGAGTSLPWWVGAGLVGAGIIAAAGAAVLYSTSRAALSRRHLGKPRQRLSQIVGGTDS